MPLLTGSWIVDILALVIGAFTLLYWKVKQIYSFWDRKYFKTVPGYNYITGHLKEVILQRESISDWTNRLYKSTSDPFIGIYSILRPVLLVRDPELVRSVLIKDFTYFTDRGVYCDEDIDPLSANLLALPGDKWKNVRSKLSPTFTSGKLKAMFSTLVDSGSTLQKYLIKIAESGFLLDVREISARYSTNVIASVAFGIEVDTITNPDNDFRKYGRRVFETDFWRGIRNIVGFIAPKLMIYLRIKAIDKGVDNFVRSMVKQNLEHREKNKVVRKDFFQLLIQLRNSGTVRLDDQWQTTIKGDESQKTLTEDQIAAHTFIFFLAGFETSSTALSFCLYELAKNLEIQRRVHAEIDQVLGHHYGRITYDSISEMKYLETCVLETLRKYPPVPILNRTCVRYYQIPGTNKIIEKGVEVFIPVFAMQRDEKYYENPDKFDPERFSDENSAGKNHLNRPFLAFGDGPRNCIGMRMGQMQVKTGLVVMLQRFKFELTDKLKNRELTFDPKAPILAPNEKILLKISKR